MISKLRAPKVKYYRKLGGVLTTLDLNNALRSLPIIKWSRQQFTSEKQPRFPIKAQ